MLSNNEMQNFEKSLVGKIAKNAQICSYIKLKNELPGLNKQLATKIFRPSPQTHFCEYTFGIYVSAH